MLWLQWRPFSARVEVLRRKQGAYSGIKVVCFLICIGRDAPFGAKPPQAGSHRSLMYLTESKELFYHKGCKFTRVGVDQTRRRSLTLQAGFGFASFATLTYAKLRLRRLFSLQPKVQHYSTPAPLRMTKSADGFRLMRRFASPTSKTASRFWNCGAKPRRRVSLLPRQE